MKRILIFIFLVVYASTIYPQAPIGKYEVYLIGWLRGDSNHHCGEAWVDMTLVKAGNTETINIFYAQYRENSPRENFDKQKTVRTFNADKQIQQFKLHASRRIRDSCSGTRPNSGGYLTKGLNQPCYSHSFEFDGANLENYYKNDASSSALWNSAFTLYIRPKLHIMNENPSENILPTDRKVTLYSHTGFKTDEYNWQYYWNNQWHNLPQYKGHSSISITAKDILGQNVEVGKDIEFRQIACDDITESNTVTYTILQTAPGITSLVWENPTCEGYSDGYVKLKLDRALLDDEDLRYMVGISTAIPITLDNDNWFRIEGLEGANIGKSYTIQLTGFRNGFKLDTDGVNHKKTVTLTSPPALSFTSSKTDILCHNYHTGRIEINATGGNINTLGRNEYYYHFRKKGEAYANDSVSFNTTANRAVIEDLPHGEYQVFVTDSKGCFAKTPANLTKESTEHTFNITQPETPITVALADSLRPSGFGLSNGYLKMNVTGGIRTADPQIYTVTWFDKVTNTQLKQENLNSIYNFEILNIPAGNYELKVATAHCDTILQYSLGQDAPLIVNISQTAPILCNGDVNAALIAQASGGYLTGGQDYDYEWYSVDNSNNIISGVLSLNNKLENIGVGKYMVKAFDKSRVVNDTTQTILVTQPDSVSFSVAGHSHVTCPNGNDASITVNASGGIGRYKVSYLLKEDPSVNNMISFGTGDTSVKLENLTAGTYEIKVVDGNDCTGYFNLTDDTHEVVITQPDELVIQVESITNPSGFGLSNGEISYRISGGTFISPPTPSYTIEITDSLSNIIPNTTIIDGQSLLVTASSLPKGRYTISVKDANYVSGGLAGCINTYTVRLTEPELLTVNLNITSTVDCHGFDTGTIEAIVAGGQINSNPTLQSYIYNWERIESGTGQSLSFTDYIAGQLPAGTYKVTVTDYATPTNQISAQIEITQPPLLVTTVSTRKVSCFSGNDGYIHISVAGGVGGYRLFCKLVGVDKTAAEYPIEADNATFRLDRLTAGKYEIYIQDANGCYAQINGEDIHTFEIAEPYKALEIVRMSKTDPSGFGRADGSITLHINGGTPNPDNTYNLIWKDKQRQTILSTTQGSFVNGLFITSLENQSDGEYTVEIRDGNYNIAYTDANACCFATATYSLVQPQKLEVEIEETHYISCNGRSDGELTAHVSGGIKNTDAGLPYKYQWYKEDAGNFIILTNETDSILKNRMAGNYKAEIEDYSRITNKTSIAYLLAEPEILKATSTQKLIVCSETTDVVALPTGGTMPYHYEWNTGETIQTLKDRYPGKYFVFITDSRGCETASISHITTPSDLEVFGTYTDPVCYGATNGSITLTVKGGTAPYTYKWSNGAISKDLNNIGAGYYTVVVTDKDECSYSESFILEDPEPLTVDIGEDRTLCNGQELTLSPTIEDPKTKFNWTGTNGFTSTSPTVTIRDAGEYSLTITDSKGCTATDKMTLSISLVDIDSEMAIATQLYVNDTIAIVNISNPEPDRIEWVFNEKDPVKIVQKEQHLARVIFSETGNYTIGIRSYMGDCYKDVFRTVTVIEQDEELDDKFSQSLIEEFYVAPNPNDGNFHIVVKLSKESPIRLRIINFFNGTTVSDRRFSGRKEYREDYSLMLGNTSMHLVLLETSAGQRVFKMLTK